MRVIFQKLEVTNILSTQDAELIALQYLTMKYGKDKAIEIFAQSRSNLLSFHGLAWELGRDNFRFFCEFFLHDFLFDYSGGKVELSDTHYEIWRDLQDIIQNRNGTNDVFIFPREFGKTSTITVPLAIWVSLYGYHRYVAIGSATVPRAEAFLATIKMQIEGNQLIEKCFGNVVNKNLTYNAHEIELDIKPQRTYINCVSAGQSLRGTNYLGNRIGLLILDDMQDPQELKTDEKCAELINHIDDDALKALDNANNHVIAVGTVYRKGDLYDHYAHSPMWRLKRKKCILVDDVDAYFKNNKHWQKFFSICRENNDDENLLYKAEDYYYDHKEEMDFPVIWKNYRCLQMAKSYFKNPVSFKREYQGEIDNLGEKFIKSLSAISADQIESNEYTNTILSVDPAATTNKKSDFSAFCVLSDTEKHIKYARKMIIGKMEFDDYISTIIRLLLTYTDINVLSVEKQVYMGADIIKLREIINMTPELVNRPLTIINKSRTKNKDNRIGAIIPDINMGRIVFNEEDTEAIEQIKEFAGTAYTEHDDMIDALADACELIPQIKSAGNYYFVPFSAYGIN